jgi:hypothetical protein
MARVSAPAAIVVSMIPLFTPMAGCAGEPERGGDADAGPVVARPAARCVASERVGLVEIREDRFVYAEMFDRTDPWIADPVLADSSCVYHSFVPQQCDGCADDEICDVDGRCATIPRRALDGRLVLRAGAEEQVFEAEPVEGLIHGDITLPGASFAVEVVAFGQRITLEPETSIPEPLPGFSASLLGTYDAPEGIEATWDPVPRGSHVFTHIPINHHAAGPTFTECVVEGSAGSLSIGQPMLAPLAVATGLEFQSFDHTHFAAAETTRGCVEFRFARSVGRPDGA